MKHRHPLDKEILRMLEADPTSSYLPRDIAAQTNAQQTQVEWRLRILAVDACVQRLPEGRFMAMVGQR